MRNEDREEVNAIPSKLAGCLRNWSTMNQWERNK